MQSSKLVNANKTLASQYDQEYLNLKTADLRQSLESLAQGNGSLQPAIDEIRKNLDLISTEPLMRVRWNLYQLSFRRYLRICEPGDLLGAFRGLRSRTYRLDRPNKEIWNEKKLDSIESQLGGPSAGAGLRAELDSLAKAIDECGFRYTRDNDLKSGLIKEALRWNVFVFALTLATVCLFSNLQIGAQSPYERVPILLFGVSGGLLSGTLQQRRERMFRHTMGTERLQLLFRGVFGAIAAVIVNMFLELRIIDFPVLKTGSPGTADFPLSALYIVAFVSGFSEVLFLGALEKISLRRTATSEKSRGANTTQ